jgi:hypothetical protein
VGSAARSRSDVCFVEPRDDIRIIVNIPGRYSLASKLDMKGARREFACRVINMSTRRMGLVVPVRGRLGERVITYIPRFGKLDGNITRYFQQGFVMSINGTQEFRFKLAAKLDWLEKHKNHDLTEGRRHIRIVPRNPYSSLTLPGGHRVACLVMDMSVSGAGVSADADLRMGARVRVGHVTGRVVRAFKEGFAVQFDAVQKVERLEQSVIAYS